MLRSIAYLLFAPECAGCGIRGPQLLCEPCTGSLVEIGPSCPRCAEPQTRSSIPCARCRRDPLPLTAVIAPWRFGGALADALRRLKFGGQTHVARTVAPLISPYLAATVRLAEVDAIVPVPLHWRRRLVRGFDQTALLVGNAVRHAAIDVPVVHALRRRRATRPQTRLAAAARSRNVAGAFATVDRHRDAIAGKRVLLVDDVATTCSTLAAASRALRAAGAIEVIGFAIARAEA
jgi:ComF family protein